MDYGDTAPNLITLLSLNLIGSNAVLLSLCYSNLGFDDDKLCTLLKELLKRGATPSIVLDDGKTAFDYACLNNRSYDFLKTLAYAGCWFNPALEYRDSDEIRQLKKSKEQCSVAVIILYGVLKKRLKQPRDTTRIITKMVWEKRFDML